MGNSFFASSAAVLAFQKGGNGSSSLCAGGRFLGSIASHTKYKKAKELKQKRRAGEKEKKKKKKTEERMRTEAGRSEGKRRL